MSRLIERLNQVSQPAPQPMGFRATATAESRSKMLLIAGLTGADLGGVADYVAGADAGLLTVAKSGPGPGAIKKAVQVVPDIPWGGRFEDVGKDEISQMVEAGADFVVFPPDSAVLPALQDGAAGKILEVEASLTEGLLRAVDKLSVDAVLINAEPERGDYLTWQHLMHLQRCADMLTKPLLASVPTNVTTTELQTLWEAGVDGIVVRVRVGEPAGSLKELRKVIDGLTFPSKRKRGRTVALLPYTARGMDRVTEEAEED